LRGVSSVPQSTQTSGESFAGGRIDAPNPLVSKLRDTKRTKPARNLPLRVAFPHFGPSIFMVAELTSENQTPVVELDFQRDKKRGDK
jgi:hypothetical protein